MRVSAHVTPNDHQEFQQAFTNGGLRLALLLKCALLVAMFIYLLTSLITFAITLAQATHEGGLAFFLDHPVLAIGVVLVLLCVPRAAVILWGTGPTLRVLRSASAGKIDAAALREGINLGESYYDIGDERLRVDLDLIQESYPWHVFSKLKETDNLLCLMLGKSRGIMVPKRAFDDTAALEAFRTLFMSRKGTVA